MTRYKDALLRRWSFPLFLTQNFVSSPATFVRREAFDEVGLFEERFKYSMDYDVWLKLGRRSAPIVIDEPLACFRMAEGSLSMSGFERQFAEHVQNAREHGDGHPIAVAANVATSRAIVAVYHGMRHCEAAGRSPTPCRADPVMANRRSAPSGRRPPLSGGRSRAKAPRRGPRSPLNYRPPRGGRSRRGCVRAVR